VWAINYPGYVGGLAHGVHMCYTRIGLAETKEKPKDASVLIVGSWW